jgi:hypothetical protein
MNNTYVFYLGPGVWYRYIYRLKGVVYAKGSKERGKDHPGKQSALRGYGKPAEFS